MLAKGRILEVLVLIIRGKTKSRNNNLMLAPKIHNIILSGGLLEPSISEGYN
jgi:hypothetical protein